MSSAKTPESDSYSEVAEEKRDEEFVFYDVTEEESIYRYDLKKNKRKTKKVDQDWIIQALKPKRKPIRFAIPVETKPNPKRTLKMGGGHLTKKDSPIYNLEQRVTKEALYFVEDEDVSIANESIYETVQIEQDIIYSKGKERNKETAISGRNTEERIGRYSDMEVDYSFGEKPYADVYLEEVVTEGRLQDKKVPKKKPIEDNGKEVDATIEDIVFDDDEEDKKE